MTTLTNCPHCGKPLVRSAHDLQPKALALLRLIGDMQAPDVEKHSAAKAFADFAVRHLGKPDKSRS